MPTLRNPRRLPRQLRWVRGAGAPRRSRPGTADHRPGCRRAAHEGVRVAPSPVRRGDSTHAHGQHRGDGLGGERCPYGGNVSGHHRAQGCRGKPANPAARAPDGAVAGQDAAGLDPDLRQLQTRAQRRRHLGAVRVVRAHARRRGLQSRDLPGVRQGVVRRSAGGVAMKPSRRRGSGRQKILVIEDDAVARADLEARLAANGYLVARAADAASALTVVNRERPDLILLDLGLPAGDGFLVLERLRKIEALAAIPVLVITGRSDAETRKRVEAMGVAPLLAKPVDTEVLLAAIRAGLEAKPD